MSVFNFVASEMKINKMTILEKNDNTNAFSIYFNFIFFYILHKFRI